MVDNFSFLEKECPKLYNQARNMEEQIAFGDYENSLNWGSKFFETLVNETYSKEKLPENILDLTIFKKIKYLEEYQIIPRRNIGLFHDTRKIRNNFVHGKGSMQNALIFNKNCFWLAYWFYKKFYKNKMNPPNYEEPQPNSKIRISEDRISDIVKRELDNHFEFNKKTDNGLSYLKDDNYYKHKTEDNIKDYYGINNSENIGLNGKTNDDINYNKDTYYSNKKDKFINNLNSKNESSLIKELSKLNNVSANAIEGCEGLDEFKEYIHIKREIQDELINKLEKVKNSNKSHLILLAGSVGDGKSHLLSYMQNHSQDLMDSFDIHNDATESFDPNLTAIDTLLNVLEPFNDENIDKSNKKMILAINLGILSNLLDNSEFKSNFSKLKEKIESDNVFDSSIIVNSREHEFLTIFTFSDYNLYEIDEYQASSKFLNELFLKIVDKTNDNPFYRAYKSDIEKGLNHPVLINYEMFSNNEVREIIIQLLIKNIIKNKKLISTRELLNFIYEILVPSKITNYNNSSVYDYIDDLLPILLFKSKDRSDLLEDISEFTPLNIRSKDIDKFLIDINSHSIEYVINNYFEQYDEFSFFREFLLTDDYNNLDTDKRQKIRDNLLLFLLFFAKDDIKKSFVDDTFNEFIENLYYYNQGDSGKLRALFKKIVDSIFNLEGTVEKNVIIIDDLNNFKVGKKLEIEFKIDNKNKSVNRNKFKTEIILHFLVDNNECNEKCSSYCKHDNCVKLNIDYLLFESIIKIYHGYQPNSSEKENLILFNNFIKSIINKSKNNQILIKNKNNNSNFKFKKTRNIYIFEEE